MPEKKKEEKKKKVVQPRYRCDSCKSEIKENEYSYARVVFVNTVPLTRGDQTLRGALKHHYCGKCSAIFDAQNWSFHDPREAV